MSEPRKSIFTTGAAAGIGRASALRFAAAGWRVELCHLDLVRIYLAASVPRWRSRVHGTVGGGTVAAALSQKLLPAYRNRAIQKHLSGH